MRGFTLIEIMVVVVIIGLLATFGGYHVFRSKLYGEREIAKTKCEEYYNAAHMWEMQSPGRRLPQSLEEMHAPIQPGERDYLRPSQDPWGNAYVLEHDGKDVRVTSWGEDRQEGTEDDLVWPEPE
ncbi:MAG TPA: prepilin-type N-terminal cleavage/methylation domain-containing protein [Planctomycetota bacterium]|nr:prepilin-type N-terminal cleavage/methylation domain-containing protein [Planctomycetota bacterium]